MDYKGIDYLKHKLDLKRKRVDLRYRFYDMKNIASDFDSMPREFWHMRNVLGWCATGVDSLADRLVFREFADDVFDLNGIFAMNNPDIMVDSAIQGALIAGCDFIYISPGDDGFPRMQVLDGSRATGIMDPITGMLTEGYAILETDTHGHALVEAYFIAGRTDYYYHTYQDGTDYKRTQAVSVDNVCDYPLLVPMVFRPDAKRPFGHSRISRACMSIVESAMRTVKRSEITSEFYSFPQKWVSGLAKDVEIDTWRASISTLLAVTKDQDGDKPTFGQFNQQSMEPHIAELKMLASLFAGETGLTLDDLGFTTDNPSSAEAIKATHENLRLTAKKAQRTFGSGLLNAGYLAACIRDDWNYQRSQLYLTTPKWMPVFEPDSAMLSAIGDGLLKLSQAVPDADVTALTRDLTGFDL